ncbi:hypothetical protein ACPPVO_14485 [Dactylosporangium sp. McL0621]|uniref:hypothetical protein n=1 Tax=Dactylosporangium sp. McL0621 TaxID=3415678 RepID=UPI003CEA663B
MHTKRRRTLGLLTAAVIGVGSIAYAPVAANAMQTVCDKNGYVKQGSKGLTVPGSTGEVIRLWWYKNSANRWCAYTELRNTYYDNGSTYNIGVRLLNYSTVVDSDSGPFYKYAGPVEGSPVTRADGWIVWGGTPYHVYSN